jgi:SAM-dependent methyltransferase
MTADSRAPFDEVSANLVRVRREREAADRAYNEALTALDCAIVRIRDFPAAPPPFDESQLASLNERWSLLPFRPADGTGWVRRLQTHIWALVGPLFQRQQDFNATVVDHVNRNAAMHRESVHALASTLAICSEELARLAGFESTLVQYAQTVTAYVDTKDRVVEALPNTLEATTRAFGGEMQKRWESMAVRDRRFQAEVDEVRSTLGVAHRAILTLKRELEQRPPAGIADAPSTPAVAASTSSQLNSYKYVGFEDQFRGSPADIRERLLGYLADFDGCRDVLDIGCGRGEFLELLRERGITARGVDLNDEMVAICRERGLEATTTDALSYLAAQPDESLGGLFGAQVVEHLEPDYLMRLLETAYHKLRPGSVVVLETINPACWFAFFSSYIRDITHQQPLHPDTLRYLMVASGFQRVDVRYAAPYPDASKLQPIPVPADEAAARAAEVFNENVSKLNGLFFTFLDYAVIARRT